MFLWLKKQDGEATMILAFEKLNNYEPGNFRDELSFVVY